MNGRAANRAGVSSPLAMSASKSELVTIPLSFVRATTREAPDGQFSHHLRCLANSVIRLHRLHRPHHQLIHTPTGPKRLTTRKPETFRATWQGWALMISPISYHVAPPAAERRTIGESNNSGLWLGGA